jgi:CheY-specific phosphatase CheX
MRTVTVAYIKPKKKNKPVASLVVLEGKVHGDLLDDTVEAWANSVMQSLYEGKSLIILPFELYCNFS